jgi:hypothetical protein
MLTMNRELRHKQPLSMQARRVRYCHTEGPLKARPLNVSMFTFHALLKNKEQLIIFEKLISINKQDFRFTNVEVARKITSTMKSLR